MSAAAGAGAAAILEEAHQFVAAARASLEGAAAQVQILDAQQQDSSSKDQAALAGLLDRYDAYCFDCDGVLWQGAELLPGAAATLELLRCVYVCMCGRPCLLAR